jgi:hypothetical protein
MEGKTAHHPCFSAKMHASRQCGYYIWNIYLFLVQEILLLKSKLGNKPLINYYNYWSSSCSQSQSTKNVILM